MLHTDVIDYLKTWATRILEIQHTTAKPRFFHNIDELRDQEVNMEADQFYMVMEDRHTGQLGGNKENFRDQPRFAVSFVRKAKPTDWYDEEVAFSQAKAIAFKLVGYMNYDNLTEADTIARFITEGSFTYRRIGPQLDNLHGCQLSWQLSDNINDQVQYDADHYLPE